MMVLTKKYIQLLQDFPPHSITSKEDLEAVQVVIDNLLNKPNLSIEERDHLNLLSDLVYVYENQQEVIPDIYGIELLKALMTEHKLLQKDMLHIFKSEAIISKVINGKRPLNVRHIEELSKFFHVSPAVFFPK